MNGNVCPARLDSGPMEGGPHEPEMFDEDNFLWAVYPSGCDSRLRACKWCGCLYLLPKEEVRKEPNK